MTLCKRLNDTSSLAPIADMNMQFMILLRNQKLQDSLIPLLHRKEELKKSTSALKTRMEVDLRKHEASMKAIEEEEAERASRRSSVMIASLEKAVRKI